MCPAATRLRQPPGTWHRQPVSLPACKSCWAIWASCSSSSRTSSALLASCVPSANSHTQKLRRSDSSRLLPASAWLLPSALSSQALHRASRAPPPAASRAASGTSKRAAAPAAPPPPPPPGRTSTRTRVPQPVVDLDDEEGGSGRAAVRASAGWTGDWSTPVQPEQIATHRRAKAAQAAGRVGEALRILYAGLQRFPYDRNFCALATSLEAQRGNVEAALAIIGPALAREPGNVFFLTAAAGAEDKRPHNEGLEAARHLYRQAAALVPRSAKVVQAWGMVEAAAGHTDAARALFARACRNDPEMPHTYTAWARLEAAQGQGDRARSLFQEGAKAAPINAPLLHAWAQFEVDRGRLGAAKPLLLQATRWLPSHLPSWMLLGRVEWLAGNANSARGVFEAGLAAAGPSSQLLNVWARLELGVTNVAAAAALVARARAINPHDAQTLHIEAQMEDRVGNFERSDALYDLIAARDAISPHLLMGRARACLRRGDTAAAVGHLDALQRVDSNNGYLCYMRGALAQREGLLDEAAAWFLRGMRAPGMREALLNYEGMAEVHAFQGRPDDARGTLKAGLARLPGPPTGRFLRQCALFEKKCPGREEAAALLFRQSAKRNPLDSKTWLAWAVFERRRRKPVTAERCFQRGLNLAPRDANLWYAYTTMVRLRDVPRARAMFQSGTRWCPRAAPLWMEWALMEWDEGDTDLARRLFEAGAQVPTRYQHAPLYQLWASLEAELETKAARAAADAAAAAAELAAPTAAAAGSAEPPLADPTASTAPAAVGPSSTGMAATLERLVAEIAAADGSQEAGAEEGAAAEPVPGAPAVIDRATAAATATPEAAPAAAGPREVERGSGKEGGGSGRGSGTSGEAELAGPGLARFAGCPRAAEIYERGQRVQAQVRQWRVAQLEQRRTTLHLPDGASRDGDGSQT